MALWKSIARSGKNYIHTQRLSDDRKCWKGKKQKKMSRQTRRRGIQCLSGRIHENIAGIFSHMLSI